MRRPPSLHDSLHVPALGVHFPPAQLPDFHWFGVVQAAPSALCALHVCTPSMSQ